MPKGICKFCGQEKELINSHIMPLCLYQISKLGGVVAVDTQNKRIDRDPAQQNGLKEPLMCAECDNAMGKLDGYANKILNHVIPKLPPKRFMGGPVIVRYLEGKDFDYDKFRKFFISLLWRFSVSNNRFNLGKYEAIALKILKGEIPDDETLFLPLLYRKVTGNSFVDHTTFCGHVRYLKKYTAILKFPGYEIRAIINTKHASNNPLMAHFRTYFTRHGVLVTDVAERTPTDRQLMNSFMECRKSLAGDKRYVPWPDVKFDTKTGLQIPLKP